MPNWYNAAYRQALGRRLRLYRMDQRLDQSQLAARLGITQAYLSRLERGDRLPGFELLQRIQRLLDATQSADAAEFDVEGGDLERSYDRALLALGGGDIETAEALLRQILVREGDGRSSPEFYARTRSHLAGIRRDRGELLGPQGAVTDYRRSLDTFLERGQLAAAREVTFLLGACAEMIGQTRSAKVYYLDAQAMALASASPQAQARALNRLGVLATKTHSFAVAKESLTRARELALWLEDPAPYSLILEKSAALALRTGHLGRAMQWAEEAKTVTGAFDPLRTVQNHVLTADILATAGDDDEANKRLGAALVIAQRMGYQHQIAAATKIRNRLR